MSLFEAFREVKRFHPESMPHQPAWESLCRYYNEATPYLNTYIIALDGVNFFSSEKISCPKCLKREDRSGTEHFYRSAIQGFNKVT